MEKNKTFCCGFCGAGFMEKEKMQEHEKLCGRNPRHACCENCAAYIAGNPPGCRFGKLRPHSPEGRPAYGLCRQWQAKL